MELFTMLRRSVSNAFSCIQTVSILLFLQCGIYNLDALKCYTCGETNTFLGSNYTNSNPVSCRDFESSNQEALQKYIIDCPPEYLGCITQSQLQGDVTIRTCDTFAIDDCQTANGVTYCYCNYDLCNGQNVLQTKVQHHIQDAIIDEMRVDEPDILSDDEDYVDMSGFGHLKNSFEEQDETIENTVTNTLPTSVMTKTIPMTTIKIPSTLVTTRSSTTEMQNMYLMNSTTIGIDAISDMPTTIISINSTTKNRIVNSSMGIKVCPAFQCFILPLIIGQLCNI